MSLQESALALEEIGPQRARPSTAPSSCAELADELERVIAFFADPLWQARLDVEPTP